MSGALVLIVAIGGALLLAVMLGRMPVDRAPEHIYQWKAIRPVAVDPNTQAALHYSVFWSRFYNNWARELASVSSDDLMRWADDGGPA